VPANIRDTQFAISYKKQAAIATPNPSGDYWRVTKVNQDLANVSFGTEPIDEIGTGTDWITGVSKTAKDVNFPIEKILSSQFAAWAFGMAMGKVSKSGSSSPFTYTITPIVPGTDCLNLPVFTALEKVPHCGGGADTIFRALAGCAINELTLTLEKGPQRASARLSASIVGTGWTDEATSITMPSTVLVESRLPAASMTFAINGQTDLVSAGLISSITWTYSNNARTDDGYFPGSGVQDGFAIRGRMEMGEQRSIGLSFTARAKAGTPELASIKALTEGTAVIGLQGDLISGADYHSLGITMHRLVYSAVELPPENGLVGVRVTSQPMLHSSNGLCTVVVKTNENNICSAST
jgi:hypothetical protein